MKIGIITIQKCGNYGADLQAFALQRKLQLMGYDAENIDYLFYKHPRHLGGKGEKPVLRIGLVNAVKERLYPLMGWVNGWMRASRAKNRARRFAEWVGRNVKCGREYRSVSSLYEDKPQYDVYMVGSDQVWNPRMYSNIKPYFLDFAPTNARCVGYASSFGVGEIPPGAFYWYKKWLSKFSAIGLRERTGVDIVNAMGLSAEIKHVLDPTLLLDADEWASVANRPEGFEAENGYVLLYDLIASNDAVSLAHRWAEKTALPVVRIADGDYGPGEFAWLFAHARAVVTNSFHGTAFAVLNRKPFFSVIPKGMTNAGRIESLLSSLGADSRLVCFDRCGGVDLDASVDFDSIIGRLDDLRRESADFLERSVSGNTSVVERRLPLGCYAAWNANDGVRANSTSGGIFRVLAEKVIEMGGVVYGAAFTADFRKVKHVAAETINALDSLMKSKYVWSDPTEAYRDAISNLRKGRHVLFSGTPCQIAAIKKMADGIDEKLVTVDIVCHGTPLPEIFESYIRELEDRFGGRVKRYEFRDKSEGWNFPRVVAEFEGNRIRRGGGYNMILRNDPYYLAFGLNASLRPGCFKCPFVGLERVADFTIADCWRVAASNPEWDDNRGTSLVLVNTSKAKTIWDGLISSGLVKGGEYDMHLAQMRNMPLQQRAKKPVNYEKFNNIFKATGSFGEAAKCVVSKKLRFRATVVYWVKKLGWFYFRRHQ